jgi:hypothetical protein
LNSISDFFRVLHCHQRIILSVWLSFCKVQNVKWDKCSKLYLLNGTNVQSSVYWMGQMSHRFPLLLARAFLQSFLCFLHEDSCQIPVEHTNICKELSNNVFLENSFIFFCRSQIKHDQINRRHIKEQETTAVVLISLIYSEM